MKNKTLILLGIVLLVLAAAGGSFYGGMLFQRTRVNNTRAAFFADRGGAPDGFPGGFPGGAGGAQGGASRGAIGLIKSIEGNTLTLSTPQSEMKVTLTDTTAIQKVVDGAAGDLQVGDTVTVRGERDAQGNIPAATGVQINPSAVVPAP